MLLLVFSVVKKFSLRFFLQPFDDLEEPRALKIKRSTFKSVIQQKIFPRFRQDDDVNLPVLEILILIFDFLQFRLKSL